MIFKVMAYMVQLMTGFGRPSAEQKKVTLVSGPAMTLFTSSVRRTAGGAAEKGHISNRMIVNT